MARTRLEIQELVILNTARTDKISLIQKLCDTALKVADLKHPFQDASVEAIFPITFETTSVDISTQTWVNMRTLRIVDSSTVEQSNRLTLKSNIWFDKNYPFPPDNMLGWPVFGTKISGKILFERPVEENKSLYIRGAVEQVFADDSTPCPIELLDIFVEEYVTSKLLMSYHEYDKGREWMSQAISSLKLAIDNDTDIAQTSQAERGTRNMSNDSIVTNGLQGSPQTYVRETRNLWY
jgi:hypothetical protein